MDHVKVLDCTLRDGAYLVDKNFGDISIHGITRGLMDAKIDIIEIGFLQNEGFGEGKVVFADSRDAEKFIPADKNEHLFTVLADYSRYDINLLDDCTGRSFDAVRACFFKHERFAALEFCKTIQEKGYLLFVQPVDVLGYSDQELIEFIHQINMLDPYCFSMVDTFGSMYTDDLRRIYSLVHHNLIESSMVGFHSHNNLQMSNALSQEFVQITQGQRNAVVDATVSGLGRGAGNTPTELLVQYLVSKLHYNYDVDAILDIMDVYIDNIRAHCSWGYSTPFFLAGTYNAHVNNLTYLTQKKSLRSKDIRCVVNLLDADTRKRYDYPLLENTFVTYQKADIDDESSLLKLNTELKEKNIVIMAPGRNAKKEAGTIQSYVKQHKAVVITINFFHEDIASDYIYLSNVKRYEYIKNDKQYGLSKKIVTSNITENVGEENYVISFSRLIKCGWENLDNSSILLLRLLDLLDVTSIAIAGLDGFGAEGLGGQYASENLESPRSHADAIRMNKEIQSMLHDFFRNRKSGCDIRFITKTRFSAPENQM
jgi:4-hydroxy 2-oxovalerate aldolase